MYEYPEEQNESVVGLTGTGQSRLKQYLSQVGSPANDYRKAATQLQPQQSGGAWMAGRTQSPPSNLPASPKPSKVQNGAAGSPQFELVSAQDAMRNDPKNKPGGGKTYCNIATYQIAQRMGAPMDPFTTQVEVSKMYPKGQRPATANEIATHLKDARNYRVVTPEEAQALANQGKFVVAVQPHEKHGHVATVRPDNLSNEEPPATGQGPVMNHIGQSIGVRRASGTFYSTSAPVYYAPVESNR